MTEAATRPRASRRAQSALRPVFVGTVDLREPVLEVDGTAYDRARLLVVDRGHARGVVEVDVLDGRVDGEAVRAAARDLPLPEGRRAGAALPTSELTVAVCTRNRAAHLHGCLAALRALPGDDLQVLVIDNGSDGTAREVARAATRADHRVRVVREDRVGLSVARNRALAEATTPWVAFVDDDVRVEAAWLSALRRAIPARDGSAPACVTGPVLPAALDTPEQVASDHALGWAADFHRRRFALCSPSDSPLFPFCVGEYGVGANLAVDAAVARALGGFDERLGTGSRTRGGEDIDFFVRLVLGGGEILYEPDAWVRHHHRAGAVEFQRQVIAYGMGLGAFLAKVCLDPVMRPLALRRLGRGLARLGELRDRMAGAGVGAPRRWRHTGALLPGALAYLRLRHDDGESPR